MWAAVGSVNLNRRSGTHDSELAAAVLDHERDPREPTDPGGLGDGARRFARELPPSPPRWVQPLVGAFYPAGFDPDGRPLGMRLRRTF